MAPHHSRPSLSITLPPNFEFHYQDGQLPKTPEQRDDQQSATDPPPPPKQTFKIKRKRTSAAPSQDVLAEAVVPTIEMYETTSEQSSPAFQPMVLSEGFLAPIPDIQRCVTPRTPAMPKNGSFGEDGNTNTHEWDLINHTRDNSTPVERAQSVFSDSSVSSAGSSAFSASHGLPTSPESATTNPFEDDETAKEDKLITSPSDASPVTKRVKKHRNIKWTQAMDDHLWMTYMTYISDPTLTPFKMLPGVSPPLGVCHRVATKARRSWKEHRTGTPGPLDAMRDGTPDTVRSENARHPHWPRSDSATRRRLRLLCKKRPMLAAHYQRLMHTRSPSPFTSSSSADPSSELSSAPSAFSSRDMNVSLVTATAPSMQPQGLLAQLANEEATPQAAAAAAAAAPAPAPPQAQRNPRPEGWFDRIGRSQAHQKSLSLQSGLGLGRAPPAITSLASPFEEAPDRAHLLQSMAATKSLGRTDFKAGPSLGPPFEGDPTMRRSLKRRFRSDEEKPKRPAISNIFSSGVESSGIVRNRGFSLGAVRASDNMSRLFTPQSMTPLPSSVPELPSAPSADEIMSEAPELPSVGNLGPTGSRSVPRRFAEPTPRLGSPFVESAANCHFNTFPRSYIPTPANPQPFQQRLQELAAEHASKQTL